MPKAKVSILYSFATLLLGSFLFAAITLFPVLNLLCTVIFSSSSTIEALYLSKGLIALTFTDRGALTNIYIACIALLTSANIMLLVYLYKEKYTPTTKTTISTSAVGTALVMLGFGCASCGTFLISVLLASLGGTSIAFLLDGFQFQIAGIGLQLFSILFLIRQARRVPVCPI